MIMADLSMPSPKPEMQYQKLIYSPPYLLAWMKTNKNKVVKSPKYSGNNEINL